ncbi:MAG: D-alanyl-D-alanine carboxypeptidase, partial [Oscillospiraceae bacterium]|nr:D-alanyl-D-alanine carboxypeptidase [Oscillospiraceae bacterium]
MKRILCFILFFLLFISGTSAAPAPPELTSPSVILIEKDTGTVLYQKEAHKKLPPASVTKVMTLLLVMEAIDSGKISLNDTVSVSEYAAGMGGSQVFLSPGEEMSVNELLKATVVSSGNDSAVALAEHIAGSESGFVDLMNKKANELGMNDTVFKNCTGLDTDGHVTSANDISIMSGELLKHEKIKDYTTIWMDTVRDGQFGLSNTNKLVRFYSGTTGLKTGYTSAAGHCL